VPAGRPTAYTDDMPPKLTDKQKLFCEEYLVDLNATQAARRAGYSEKTAYSQGQRLLKNVEAQKLVQSKMGDRSDRTQITQDRVLDEIAAIAFGDIRKLFNEDGTLKPITDLDDDAAKIIAGFDINTVIGDEFGGIKTTKVKTNDKLRSLEMLGKHLVLFTDKHEHSGPEGGPIQNEIKPSSKLQEVLKTIAERS